MQGWLQVKETTALLWRRRYAVLVRHSRKVLLYDDDNSALRQPQSPVAECALAGAVRLLLLDADLSASATPAVPHTSPSLTAYASPLSAVHPQICLSPSTSVIAPAGFPPTHRSSHSNVSNPCPSDFGGAQSTAAGATTTTTTTSGNNNTSGGSGCEFGFEVVCPHHRYQFLTESELDREHWVAALSRLVPPCSEMRGWLLKAGNRSSGWKRRYFVLHQNGLLYFEDDADAQEKARYVGTCSLDSAINVLPVQNSEALGYPTPFGIQIVCTSPQRIWQLCAESAEEQRLWVQHVGYFVPTLGLSAFPFFGGHLTKRGGTFKNWKKRFFAVLDGVLVYCADVEHWKKLLEDEEARREGNRPINFFSKHVSGIIPLRGAEVGSSPDSLFVITISTPSRT